MGVKNLWDILESCKKTLPLQHLQNKRVCVDLSCWMVQLQNVNRSHCALKDKIYLKGLFHRLRALIALNCSLIFVTDGSIPAIKLSTYRRRLNPLDEVIIDAGNTLKASAVKRNMGSEFSVMVKEAKLLGGALGIPCLDGIEEAEAQCALLNSESLCDGCFTSDSDAFLFGARTVYRDICLGEGGYVFCYDMDDIETKLGFGRNSLIALALLLGSDYTQGVRGFGPDSACKVVKSIGGSVVLQRFASDGLSVVKKQKESKKKGQTDNKENETSHGKDNGSKCDSQSKNQFLHVIDAYLKPKCHSADSDAMHRVLAVYPFSRIQLQQICTQYLDWPPEKTDEYILPKIAERELRRFDNLRSASANLGVHFPFNEMPVRCPVSSIVKRRTSKGREYFEVSWQDMHGLKASTVPADLVESACPEKIIEFQQRKAQKQKPTGKSRLKKGDKKEHMKEIDRKLHELMLDIEQENSATTREINEMRSSSSPRQSYSTALNSMEIDSTSLGSRCYSTSSHSMETEVIDLMSPSPAKSHGLSKCNEAMSIDVIELIDTDSDVSPEHARKARELRSFLANIRD